MSLKFWKKDKNPGMKVGLLREVRKRYTIIKVLEIESNPSSFMMESKEEFGLPFFWFRDNLDSFSPGYKSFCDFDDAKEHLVKVIVKDYKEMFRHKDRKQIIVWP